MWFHFIGVCGVAMGPIACAIQRQGHFVTGSDKAIYPPISSYLKKNNFKLELGYKEEHLNSNYYKNKYKSYSESEFPDYVVIGNTVSEINKEYIYANLKNLNIVSYPQIVEKYFIKENSIVITGTYGKSTITAILVKIFKDLGLNPSYMIGAMPIDFEHPAEITNSDISIIEGDEYRTSKFNNLPKFNYYHPKYLIITGIEWDHKDIFLCEEEYINSYLNLSDYTIKNGGYIIADFNDKKIHSIYEKIFSDADLMYDGFRFNFIDCKNNLKNNDINNPNLFGKFNHFNQLLSLYTAKFILDMKKNKTALKDIINFIQTYRGIRRRLQIIYKTNDLIIIDDFAHSPIKALSSIKAVKEEFTGYRIIAVYEPNMGNRTKSSLKSYKNIFKRIDKLYIPHMRIHNISIKSKLVSEEILANTIRSDGVDVILELNDLKLLEKLKKEIYKPKTVILFMGPEPFRGLIDKIVEYAKQKK